MKGGQDAAQEAIKYTETVTQAVVGKGVVTDIQLKNDSEEKLTEEGIVKELEKEKINGVTPGEGRYSFEVLQKRAENAIKSIEDDTKIETEVNTLKDIQIGEDRKKGNKDYYNKPEYNEDFSISEYEKILKISSQIKTQLQKLNDESLEVYKSIMYLYSFLYQINNKDLITDFNNVILKMNRLLQLVSNDMQGVLQKMSNNYLKSNESSIITNKEQKIDFNWFEENGMKKEFSKNEINKMKDETLTNFRDMEKIINEIENTYDNIQNPTEESNQIKNEFIKLKKELLSDFKNVEKRILDL